MFRVLGFLLVAAVQLGSFCAMAANAPDPVSPGSSFFTSLVAFQKAAGIFSGDTYGAEFTPNLTELNAITAHLKNCSNVFDAAGVQLASILQLSLSDAVALNSTDILFSQLPILGNLNFLQEGKAFFDDVSDNILILSSFCASVRDLSHQNDAFFDRLALLAPSADYAAFWSQLQMNAAAQYHKLLTEDGFECGGA